jgi:hypothetical protein
MGTWEKKILRRIYELVVKQGIWRLRKAGIEGTIQGVSRL